MIDIEVLENRLCDPEHDPITVLEEILVSRWANKILESRFVTSLNTPKDIYVVNNDICIFIVRIKHKEQCLYILSEFALSLCDFEQGDHSFYEEYYKNMNHYSFNITKFVKKIFKAADLPFLHEDRLDDFNVATHTLYEIVPFQNVKWGDL